MIPALPPDVARRLAERQAKLRAALANPDHVFTRAQVVELISLAVGTEDPDWWFNAGYDDGFRDGQRLLERTEKQREASHRQAVQTAREWVNRADARAAADRDGPAGDYQGGPLQDWGPSRGPIPVPDVSTRLVFHPDGSFQWRDPA